MTFTFSIQQLYKDSHTTPYELTFFLISQGYLSTNKFLFSLRDNSVNYCGQSRVLSL